MTYDSGALALRSSRAWQTVVAAALVGALLLAGCAAGRSIQQTVGGWADRVRGTTLAEGKPRPAYTAVAHVEVHREPDASSPVMGVLDRHAKVARYQSESGFAYVEAGGDVSGWVRESQLLERRPQVREPSSVEPARPAADEPEPPADVITAPGEPARTVPNPPAGTDATDSPPPNRDPETLEPERFDPY